MHSELPVAVHSSPSDAAGRDLANIAIHLRLKTWTTYAQSRVFYGTVSR